MPTQSKIEEIFYNLKPAQQAEHFEVSALFEAMVMSGHMTEKQAVASFEAFLKEAG